MGSVWDGSHTTMAHSFRIYGPNLGESKAYVDVTIDGITTDGLLEVSNDSGSTWEVEVVDLERWLEANSAHATSDIDTSDPVWDAVDSVETQYNNSQDNDKSHFINAVRELFKGAQ